MKILDEIREIFNLILNHSEDVSRMRFEARMKNGSTFRYSFDRQKWERELLKENLPKRETNQLINAILDVTGIAAAVAILVILVVFSVIAGETEVILYYGISWALAILYYLFSALYNFLSPAHTAREFFFKFRSILLFLTLTAFFMPLYVVYLPSNPGTGFLGGVLILCVIALYFNGLNTQGGRKMAALSGILLSWLSVASLPFLSAGFSLFEKMLVLFAAILLSIWITAAFQSDHSTSKETPAMNLFLLFASVCLFWFNLLWLGV
jgi:predicted membrane channel-forming protein YqfA (hemolysin III family)